MKINIEIGTMVLARNKDYKGNFSDEDWEEVEFLKYDKDMEYGKYICLYWSHDGKQVDCYDEILKPNEFERVCCNCGEREEERYENCKKCGFPDFKWKVHNKGR